MNETRSTLPILLMSFSSIFLMTAFAFAFRNNPESQIKSTDLQSNITQFDEVAIAPFNYQEHVLQGDALFSQGDYAGAAEQYAEAIPLQEDNPSAYAKLSLAQNEQGLYQEGWSNAKQAYTLAPGEADYALNYGLALIRNKEFVQAERLFEAWPEHPMAQFYSAVLSLREGDYQLSEKAFRALELEKLSSIEAHAAESFLAVFNLFNQQEQGQVIYLEALLAKASLDIGEYQIAELLAERILQSEKNYRDAWNILGYSQFKMQAYQEAEDAFKESKRIDKSKSETHYFLGMTHAAQGEHQEAVRAFELALLYGFERETELYKKMAESQLIAGNTAEAVASMEHVLQVESESIYDFVEPIWLCLSELEDPRRALSLAQLGAEQFPDEAMAQNLLGWTLYENGDIEAAETALKRGLKINRLLPELHFNMGQIREKQGQMEAARDYFEESLRLSKPGSSIYSMATERLKTLDPNQE